MSEPIGITIAISLLSALMALFPIAHGSTATTEPSGIILSTNEVAYVLGETVQVNGKVEFPQDLNNLMVMKVFTPSGELFRVNEFKINNDGGFVWSFNLPTTDTGEWTINARFSTKESQVVINVLEADVFDKVLLDSATLQDSQGNNITSVGGRVGESIAIGATLVNDEQVSQPFMLIVQIADEDGVVSSMLLTLGSFQPEESINPSVSWLPEEQGSYTAEIFVWSSLNSPTPLVEKHAVAFNINSV